jgi:hypothetical protein
MPCIKPYSKKTSEKAVKIAERLIFFGEYAETLGDVQDAVLGDSPKKQPPLLSEVIAVDRKNDP